MGPTEPNAAKRRLLVSRNAGAADHDRRQWAARRPVLLGLILPSTISLVALAALTGGVWDVIWGRNGPGSGIFLIAFAAFVAWVAIKTLRTVWLVAPADSFLLCVATAASWTVPFDDVTSVTQDAYNLLTIMTTRQGRLYIWSNIDKNQGLIKLISSRNPSVRIRPIDTVAHRFSSSSTEEEY